MSIYNTVLNDTDALINVDKHFGDIASIQGVPLFNDSKQDFPDGKVYVVNMGPSWGRKDPGGLHDVPMNLAI